MYIKKVYDLIEFAKQHPRYTYTNYEGERLVYNENGNLVHDVKINPLMMKTLEDLGLLDFDGCTISHRAVRNYKISSIKLFEDSINEIKNVMQNLISKTKDLKIKSLTHLIEYFDDEYAISYDRCYHSYSYWGGGRYEQTLYIQKEFKDKLNKTIFSFPYYYVANLKNKGFHKFIMDFYISLFVEFDIDWRKYREIHSDNTVTMNNEYYMLKNMYYDYVYDKICTKGKNNEQNN
nr:MAG TPA: hypothetical protein [Caudoviricetes sp.]